MPVAHVNGGDHYLLRSDPMHQQAYGSNVRNCIHGADLMKVDFTDGDAVGAALCLCD